MWVPVLLVTVGIAVGALATLAVQRLVARSRGANIRGREAHWTITPASMPNVYTLTNTGNLVATTVSITWADGTVGSTLANSGPYDHVMPNGIRDFTCKTGPSAVRRPRVRVHWVSVHAIVSGHARNEHLAQTLSLPSIE